MILGVYRLNNPVSVTTSNRDWIIQSREFTSPNCLVSTCFEIAKASCFKLLLYFVELRINQSDEGLIPKMRILYMFIIQSGCKMAYLS